MKPTIQPRRNRSDAHGEQRRDRHAGVIADVLESFGLHAIPADCSNGLVCVVLVHHGVPDADARAASLTEPDEDGPCWEEKLLYEGRQIPHAMVQAATLNPRRHDRGTALATMRTAQDVESWL
jgi:hypothetical protein